MELLRATRSCSSAGALHRQPPLAALCRQELRADGRLRRGCSAPARSWTIGCFIIHCSGTSTGTRITQCCNKTCQRLAKLWESSDLALVGGLEQDAGRSLFYPPTTRLQTGGEQKLGTKTGNLRLPGDRVQAGDIWSPGHLQCQGQLQPCLGKRGSSVRFSDGHKCSTAKPNSPAKFEPPILRRSVQQFLASLSFVQTQNLFGHSVHELQEMPWMCQ